MWMFLLVSLGTIHTLRCSHINSMNQYNGDDSEQRDWNKNEETDKSREKILDKSSKEISDKSSKEISDKSSEEVTTLPTTIESSSITTESTVNRRYWLVSAKTNPKENDQLFEKDNDDKDDNLKSKITTLVEQTLHDTERKLRSLHRLKERYKQQAPYKVGFILSLVKKSKDILSELFNVAVKHRDDYKALEQLKIFELIVHTNVDTTNLVRQMVEIHIQYVNSSSPLHYRSRVVLL